MALQGKEKSNTVCLLVCVAKIFEMPEEGKEIRKAGRKKMQGNDRNACRFVMNLQRRI